MKPSIEDHERLLQILTDVGAGLAIAIEHAHRTGIVIPELPPFIDGLADLMNAHADRVAAIKAAS